MISIISAMAENRVIGVKNTIPWHISEDFKHFKKTTMGAPMIMGRKTFESLPGILPGRPHIVVSRSGFEAEGIIPAASLEEAIEKAGEISEDIFIIGGGQIYAQALPLANRLILTEVHQSYDGDAFFPEFPAKDWVEAFRAYHEGDPPYSFVTYERI